MSFFPPNLTPKQQASFLVHLFKALTRRHHRELESPLRPHIRPDAVIFDVGAHAGQMAKLFQRLAPRGAIHSYEPQSYARAILRKIVAVRGLSRVTIHAAALSNREGEIALRTPIKKSGAVGYGLAHIGDNAENARVETVPMRTLDSEVARLQLPRVDLIKVDIEGHELTMLQGATETLAKHRPALLLECVDRHLRRAGTSADELWDWLRAQGYKPLRLVEFQGSSRLVEQDDPMDGDYLWLPT